MSAVNSITSNPGAESTASSDTLSGSQQTLTQNDFLQLLVAQMENQDPLNPQSDTEMAAQMAQFTSLTQTTAMSGSLAMMQANSLIGSTVTLQVDSQTTTNGIVQGVVFQNGTPEIIVNGSTYNLGQVTAVVPATTSQTSSSSQNASSN
jgi:flagellar basal-body rod modification protein FlgD